MGTRMIQMQTRNVAILNLPQNKTVENFFVWVLYIESEHNMLWATSLSLQFELPYTTDQRFKMHNQCKKKKSLGHCSWGGMNVCYIPSTPTFRQFKRKHLVITIVALFVIVQIWPKEPKCSSAGKWISKLQYIHKAYREVDYRCNPVIMLSERS